MSEVFDRIEILHIMFPHLKNCDVAWMELLDSGKINLFGYNQNDFFGTYSDEIIWPKTDYMVKSPYLGSWETDENPIHVYKLLLRDLKINKILK